MFAKLLPYDIAHTILQGYMTYYYQFKRITKRGKIRFEQRDWHGMQADARDRIVLYRNVVGNTTLAVKALLGEQVSERALWREAHDLYLEEVLNFNTRNIAETFYNSVFRHTHQNLGADPELMFVNRTGNYREFPSLLQSIKVFPCNRPVREVIEELFTHFTFDAPFEDLPRDIGYICNTLLERFDEQELCRPDTSLEIFRSIFYRNKCGYIVGRLRMGENIHPFILPLLHEADGIFVDTLLLEANHVSSIFSYHRTYFLVDVDVPSEMVDFLKTIMRGKSLGELYNSIGFEKHGKTVFYREYLNHLETTRDPFIIAPGIPGMVMSVFTLPSYNMVFKVIRDNFAPPKNVTEETVKEKYALVSLHDRVGRMADSYLFEHLTFPRERFTEELIHELTTEAASKVTLTDDTIEVRHLYVEKKMVPLNLYLETCTPEEAAEVVHDYGRAIKQLAAANIFPGDMLLKNFGVTRLNRVVFYDYDEIGFLTDYNFRKLPKPRNEEEEMAAEPWFYVAHNDIFPEEFPNFLIGNPQIRALFFQRHADLFDVHFWRGMQARLRHGELIDVFPYPRKLQFRKIYKHQQAAAMNS